MNDKPIIPNISTSCETTVEESGYHTDDQSFLNTSLHDVFTMIIDVPCPLKPLLKKENRECHGPSLDKLQFSVWGSVIPSITIPKQEKGYAGQVFNYSSLSRPAYGEVEVNFMVDNKFENYYLLTKWLDLQNDSYTGIGSDISSYMSKITVYATEELEVRII